MEFGLDDIKKSSVHRLGVIPDHAGVVANAAVQILSAVSRSEEK